MATYNIVPGSKRTVVSPAIAAGSSTYTSGIIDMQGFQSIVAELLLGTLTTGQTAGVFKVQMGNAANGSDMADLAGASITVADSDASKLEVMEVVKPTNLRYLQFVFTRNAQAAAVQALLATQYHSRKPPESDDASTVAQTVVVIDPEYSNTALTVTTSTYGGSSTKFVTTARTSS